MKLSAITVINSFKIPADREGEFFELWKPVSTYLQTKPGYLGHQLHHALAPDAPFQFVNVARWGSMAHFQDAHDTGFRELVERPAWSEFVPHRSVFEVVYEGQADTVSSE